ncbi:hypothetical protein QJS10_CPA05g01359 [Acorus calamus]|uniref:Methyltransferase-like protein 22 n=1 Tax=Acorus calamus TaxID=4465 RepID=A0AAV9EW23_ACOCL|nr:hypothetical protein QJS10_CPA05g01359 [Acorus calamus]
MEAASMEEEGVDEQQQVMSEVHLGCPPRFSGPYISHFSFSLPYDSLSERFSNSCNGERHSSCQIDLDEDGDLVLARRKKQSFNHILSIQHKIISSIPSVGLQVWRAALVLADFILHKVSTSSDFDGISSLELGAGTGLVSIVLASCAKVVFVTDIGTEILDNCVFNAHVNANVFKYQENSIRVRELDWRKAWPPDIRSTSDLQTSDRYKYSWTSSDIKEAEESSIILAADVIYMDDLTDSLFNILEKLMSCGSEKVLYLALEKRYNFSLNDLDVVANGYLHFKSYLKSEEECKTLLERGTSCFVGKLIDLDEVPKFVTEYERGKDLEIWQIMYRRSRNS